MAERITNTKPSDIELVALCKLNDRSAQSQLYHRYAQAMLNTAYRVVWNKEDAHDVLQDAFLKIFYQLNTLKKPGQLAPWIKRIVVNTAVTHAQKKGKLNKLELMATSNLMPETEIDETQINWDIQLVKHALTKLPNGYRTIISLYLLEGYDHKEISVILNISVSTSITQYNRGKKKLKNLVLKMQENGQF